METDSSTKKYSSALKELFETYCKTLPKNFNKSKVITSLFIENFNNLSNIEKIETINYLVEEFKKLKPGVYIRIDYDKNIRKLSTAKAQHKYYLRNKEKLKEYSKNRYYKLKGKKSKEITESIDSSKN